MSAGIFLISSMLNYSYRIESLLNLNLPPVKKLLDIGCGNGEYTIAMCYHYGASELYGIDIGAEAIEVANRRGIKAIHHDLNNAPYPFDDDMFDLVFAGEIIEHLMSPDGLLEEIKRVLKPGGYCVISTPNIASWNNRLLLFCGWQPYCIPTHSRYRGVGTFLGKARNTSIRKPSHISTTGGCSLPHIQFLTCRAFTELVKVHGFTIERVIGSPADEFTFPMAGVIKGFIQWVDKTVSIMNKSLANDITIVARPIK